MVVNGGDGADNLSNYGEYVTMLGGNSGDSNLIYVSIEGGAGADYIENYSHWSAAHGGDGEDNIFSGSQASNVLLDGGNDNDSIRNYSANATLDGGSGNDTINPYGNNQTIVYYKNQGQDIISYYPDFTDNNLTIYFPNATIADVQSTANYSITFNDSSSIQFYNYGYTPQLNAVSTYKFSDNKEYIYSNGSFTEK